MSRNFVFLCAAGFGLTLAAGGPAGATVRTATYTWTPATGPVAGYVLYASVDGGAEFLYSQVNVPGAVIEVDSGASLIVTVAAFDAAGSLGPRSDASPRLRLCPGDFDGDEVIADPDVARARSCSGQLASDLCAGADMNEDGYVTVSDYVALKVGADACARFAALDSCRGDMNGDGWVTSQDIYAARACVGLLPLGNCAAADIDGNGFISRNDVVIIRNAADTGTCIE